LLDTDRCANIAVSKHTHRFLATPKASTVSTSIDARWESTPMAVAEQTPTPAVAEPVTTVELRHPRMLIDGAWVDSMSGELLSVENPAKRCPIAEVPRGDTADVNGAVEAAARAFPAWSKVAPRDRGRMLLRIAEVLETRSEELARTIALETGNALRTQARPEVRLTADIFRYFGGLAGELKGETIPLGEHMLSYTRREPIGVVGAIIPWNAPVLLGALKIAPALCAGNTIALKAAEDAPLGVLLMSEIGAIINEKQSRKVCAYIEEGLQRKAAQRIFGGLSPKEGPLSEGYFAIPTVFADASNDWRLAREEIFGPVLVAIPWREEADAIRMANDSHYGLAAYVWTHDIGNALRAAHAIESGWVQVNQGLGQQPGHSYGGYKQSGIGREFSLEGMPDSFTQRKNVTVNLNTPR
jgi:acyl-CoA reductase-like NAD-dependent aldehyde dehydrogenase